MSANFRHKMLNIENSPRCTLQCPSCKRTDFKIKYGQNVPLPGDDITPDQLKKCLKYFNRINFCGQHSDPIFGRHFIEMLKICKDRDVFTEVHTAASHKPETWWREAFLANINARWVFGIDGPPELSHLYRKNQDGEHLFNMMCLAKELGIKDTQWQYIVFSYNEHEMGRCKELADSKGIRIEFLISARGLPDGFAPKNKKYDWRTYDDE